MLTPRLVKLLYLMTVSGAVMFAVARMYEMWRAGFSPLVNPASLSASTLRGLLDEWRIDYSHVIEKAELVRMVKKLGPLYREHVQFVQEKANSEVPPDTIFTSGASFYRNTTLGEENGVWLVMVTYRNVNDPVPADSPFRVTWKAIRKHVTKLGMRTGILYCGHDRVYCDNRRWMATRVLLVLPTKDDNDNIFRYGNTAFQEKRVLTWIHEHITLISGQDKLNRLKSSWGRPEPSFRAVLFTHLETVPPFLSLLSLHYKDMVHVEVDGNMQKWREHVNVGETFPQLIVSSRDGVNYQYGNTAGEYFSLSALQNFFDALKPSGVYEPFSCAVVGFCALVTLEAVVRRIWQERQSENLTLFSIMFTIWWGLLVPGKSFAGVILNAPFGLTAPLLRVSYIGPVLLRGLLFYGQHPYLLLLCLLLTCLCSEPLPFFLDFLSKYGIVRITPYSMTDSLHGRYWEAVTRFICPEEQIHFHPRRVNGRHWVRSSSQNSSNQEGMVLASSGETHRRRRTRQRESQDSQINASAAEYRPRASAPRLAAINVSQPARLQSQNSDTSFRIAEDVASADNSRQGAQVGEQLTSPEGTATYAQNYGHGGPVQRREDTQDSNDCEPDDIEDFLDLDSLLTPADPPAGRLGLPLSRDTFARNDRHNSEPQSRPEMPRNFGSANLQNHSDTSTSVGNSSAHPHAPTADREQAGGRAPEHENTASAHRMSVHDTQSVRLRHFPMRVRLRDNERPLPIQLIDIGGRIMLVPYHVRWRPPPDYINRLPTWTHTTSAHPAEHSASAATCSSATVAATSSGTEETNTASAESPVPRGSYTETNASEISDSPANFFSLNDSTTHENSEIPAGHSSEKSPENQGAPAGYVECFECVICQEEFSAGEKLCGLPCKHCFHHACVVRWLKEGDHSCPVCRAPSYKGI